MKLFKLLLLIFSILFGSYNIINAQTLIMNEVSNGPSGNQEYVEFVVVSNTVTYTCTNPNPPCIDIRGWIFDDNSGYHGSGGIATGAVRFSQDPIWSCIPLGTIILIYNNGDRNPAIPPDDLSMSDGNCTIIAPMNSVLFETNSTTPGAVACSYPNTGWTSGGNWNSTLFANTGDCARIVNLAGCEVFSVCWGSDNTNNLIYFSGSGGQKVWYFNDVDPSNQANWTSGSASPSPGNQTPGTVNNAANAAYIAQFNNGCQPITQTSVTATSVNAGCSCTGSANANASGSIGDYTYVWYDASMNPIGQTNAIATNLCAGVYYVTATSHIGCSATTSISIGSSGSTSVAVNSQTICSGNSTILNATPSIGGGTYLWSPDGQTSQSISINPSSTTTYSVSYTLSGCSTTTIGTITVKSTPTITVNSATICAGQTTTLTASGATTYTWNTGSTSSSSTNNPALTTNYTVTGTVNGCTNTAVATISVNPNPIITVNSSTVCPGQTATLTANGATTYTWNTGSTANSIMPTPASNTNYTVTGTTAGCVNTGTASVIVGSSISLSINSPSICIGQSTTLTVSGASTYTWNTGSTTNSIVVNPASTTNYSVIGTSGTCTGTVLTSVNVSPMPTVTVNSSTICSGQTSTLTASGATTYLWDTGSTSNSISVNPVSATNYTVTGTTNGCSSSTVASISITPLPTVTVNSSTICSGQTATLMANGAATYTWNTGSNSSSINNTLTSTTSYTVIGTVNGCTSTAVTSISVNPSPTVTVNSSTICAGQTTTLNANGASSYSWSTGATTNSIVISPSSLNNYTVIGTTNSCTNSVVANVSVNPIPTVTVNSSTICPGQTATLTANGANSYLWNTGSTSNNISDSPSSTNNYTVVGTTAGCSNTVMTTVTVGSSITLGINTPTICAGQTATLIANGANSYTWSTGATSNSIVVNPTSNTTYSVTGVNGFCSGTGTTIVTVNPLPVITVNSSTLCVGQTATLTANGATTYTWNDGSAGNIITISPAITTNYAVIGTTAGCSNTMTTTVNVNPLPNVAVNSETICAGQTATLTAVGANNYTWNTGATTNTLNISPISTTNYTIIGTTAGCTNTTIATVTVIPLPNVTATPVTICAGQTATLTAVGANNYVWNTGATSSSITRSPSSNTNFTVTGTSAGCSNTAVTTITVNPLPIITVNSTTICAGQITTLSANGASTYSWNNGATTSSITSSPNSNVTYTVTGTLQGCQNTNTATVIVNQTPLIIVNSSTICTGQTATLIASGANNYTWNTGATSNSITTAPNTNTTYTVVGTNAGCSTTKTATVTVNPLPVLTVNSSTICTGETTTLTANGAITYIWNTGAVSKQIAVSPTSSTTYTVIGSNNGCSSIAVTFVAVNTAPQVLFNADKLKGCAPLCVNFSDLSIITNGLINNWVWTINSDIVSTNQNPQHCFDNSGLFDVGLTVVSSNGCSSTFTVNNMIEVYTTPIADFTNDNSITDILNPEITFTNYSSNANSYNWNFGDSNGSSETNPIHIYQEEGTYLITLIAHNQYGCQDIAKKEIKVNGLFTFYAPNTFTPDENKQNDVFLPMGTGWNPNKYTLRVFDRWGLEIFKTNDTSKGWDGTILNGSEIALIDTYTWKVELEDIFKKQHSFIGHITILK